MNNGDPQLRQEPRMAMAEEVSLMPSSIWEGGLVQRRAVLGIWPKERKGAPESLRQVVQ